MTAKIRWGVLGNATVARKCVIPAIQKSCNGRVHALATRHPPAAARLAADNQIERIYDRYETLLEDPAVDAVYIPLPNHLHRPWTLKALSAGKHVLCEKPIACTAQEAHRIGCSGRPGPPAFDGGLHVSVPSPEPGDSTGGQQRPNRETAFGAFGILLPHG
jgi:D-xylose 1-dehydrogenase (NADP+, D-xylono-1,5-lactone-forming)